MDLGKHRFFTEPISNTMNISQTPILMWYPLQHTMWRWYPTSLTILNYGILQVRWHHRVVRRRSHALLRDKLMLELFGWSDSSHYLHDRLDSIRKRSSSIQIKRKHDLVTGNIPKNAKKYHHHHHSNKARYTTAYGYPRYRQFLGQW